MDLPGYRLIAHLSRTRRFDTYEVWSEDRACSCVAKVVREDRQGEQRVREALIAEGERLIGLVHPHIGPPDRAHARRPAARGRRLARHPPRLRAALHAPP
jgi:hypothetical protein